MKKLFTILFFFSSFAATAQWTWVKHSDSLFMKNGSDSLFIDSFSQFLTCFWGNIRGTISNQTDLQTALNAKQSTLVSGTNIKTVNGNSLVGSGDVSISSAVAWGNITGTLSNQTDLQTALNGKQASGSYAVTTNNLSDLSNTGTARVNIGLGNVTNESKATMFSSPTFTGTVTLPASTSFTTPVIGAATGTSFAATGTITSSGTSGIGYATGAGGTVTQATSKSTGVTLNKICGQITMNSAALAAGAEVAFTLTNNTITSTDVVIVNVQSVGTAGSYLVSVGAVANGSCSITVSNASAGSLSQAIVLNFVVIKAVSN